MTDAAQTKKTFETLRKVHALLGDTMPCSWAAYRETMTGFYRVNGATIDALARLGYFHTTENTVRFAS